jgi:catechol 2,3-dioxygenase-like lactoylglutathione lyase family enzyme
MARLSHLFVHVTDLARSRRFYVDVLGLALMIDEPGHIRVGGGGGFHLGIEETAASEVGAAGIELVIEVDDVDREFSRMRVLGVEFEGTSRPGVGGTARVVARPRRLSTVAVLGSEVLTIEQMFDRIMRCSRAVFAAACRFFLPREGSGAPVVTLRGDRSHARCAPNGGIGPG